MGNYLYPPIPPPTVGNVQTQAIPPVSHLVASILQDKIQMAPVVFAENSFTQQHIAEFVQEAERGSMMAQYYVGYMYFVGKGLPQDYNKALEFSLLAANQGHMLAQTQIGFMLRDAQDLTKSLEYYLKAANQGYHVGQYCAGMAYRDGLGVPQDYRKALEYFQMAAAQDYTPAVHNIGVAYHFGQGVPADPRKAVECYLKVGDAKAHNNIGLLYEYGEGITRNYFKALEYFQKAATSGYADASKHIERVKAKFPNAEDWTVDEVSSWMASLNLSQNYHTLIQANHVNGKVLLTMKIEDWKELGVTGFGDLRILAVNPIFSKVNAVSAVATGISKISLETGNLEPKTKPKPKLGSGRFSHNEGLDDVLYKPVIKLLEGDYKPPHSCNYHMVKDLPFVLLAVRNIPEIVEDCELVAESRLENLPPNFPILSTDEALAIAAYTYDLMVPEVETNVYHALNVILRKRDPKKMEKLKPFLFFLMSGLSKLPPLQTTVYRGIPFTSMKMIQDNYRPGGTIHWSGFTSASTDIESTKTFAQESGIIFRIKVFTGRSIRHYSSIPSEDEVLLSPNTNLIVTSGVQKEADGFFYLDLVEQVDGKSFVF